MIDDNDFITWLGGVFLAVIAFFTKRTVEEVRQTSKDISDYKVHAAQYYANRGETQHSLDRIHTRMDDMGRSIESKFETINSDLKQILHKLPKSEV